MYGLKMTTTSPLKSLVRGTWVDILILSILYITLIDLIVGMIYAIAKIFCIERNFHFSAVQHYIKAAWAVR